MKSDDLSSLSIDQQKQNLQPIEFGLRWTSIIIFNNDYDDNGKSKAIRLIGNNSNLINKRNNHET